MGTADAVARAFREEWGRVVATLIRVTGDWDLAEECAAEAFATALPRWERDGVPDRPGAWLTTTARNRAIDILRRDKARAARLRDVAMHLGGGPAEQDPAPEDPSGVPDDRLRLIFTCCHPALSLEARVALTLRTLSGLTTAEIARAFLSSEATMAKRLTRAKRKIQDAGIPYRVPPADELPERVTSTLGVLYLMFNLGYSDLTRASVSGEAIRLARVLTGLMPDEPEAAGLLALMLLQDSRRFARTGPGGDLVMLEEQDRSAWDAAQIAEGVAVLDATRRRDQPGPYQLQAAIAACHATAPAAADTDWARIAELYGELTRCLPTPVVELNRAVAVGMSAGPAEGLRLVGELETSGKLAGYHLLPATRADLLRRLGRGAEAAAAYRAALELAPSDADRRYLNRRLAELKTSI